MKINFKFDLDRKFIDYYLGIGEGVIFGNVRPGTMTKKRIKALKGEKALDFYRDNQRGADFWKELRADLGEAHICDLAAVCGAEDHSAEYKRYTFEAKRCERKARWARHQACVYFYCSKPGHIFY